VKWAQKDLEASRASVVLLDLKAMLAHKVQLVQLLQREIQLFRLLSTMALWALRKSGLHL
jgi:hypothetical protein